MSRFRLSGDWKRRRLAVFDRDNWRCVNCGGRGKLECDHKIPRHLEGTDALSNLQTLCRGCHIAKTRKENEHRVAMPATTEWRKRVRRLADAPTR